MRGRVEPPLTFRGMTAPARGARQVASLVRHYALPAHGRPEKHRPGNSVRPRRLSRKRSCDLASVRQSCGDLDREAN